MNWPESANSDFDFGGPGGAKNLAATKDRQRGAAGGIGVLISDEQVWVDTNVFHMQKIAVGDAVANTIGKSHSIFIGVKNHQGKTGSIFPARGWDNQSLTRCGRKTDKGNRPGGFGIAAVVDEHRLFINLDIAAKSQIYIGRVLCRSGKFIFGLGRPTFIILS